MSGPARLVVEADGGSRGNPGLAGYGALVRDADGLVLVERGERIGTATNNVAEYRGLIAGLQAAAELGPGSLEVRMDSKLVIEQMAGRWKVRHPGLVPLHDEARSLVRALGVPIRWTWIPRERNTAADAIANAAMDGRPIGAITDSAPPATDLDARPAAGAAPAPAPNRLSGWMATPAEPTVTLLLRHGQTPLSVGRRFSGRGPAELTDTGRAQAAAAAAAVAAGPSRPSLVVCSPLPRARATAELAARACGVDLLEDVRLAETDFGDWEGASFAEVGRRWPDELAAWLADTAVAPPGGESFADTAARVDAARSDLCARHPGTTLLLVSHVSPIKLLVAAAVGAPLTALFRLHVDLASLHAVDWFPDGPAVLRRFNDTAHLAGLDQPGAALS